ncbi:MAG: hypothetical protein H6732_07650 [Alphaproteobacteria bacterium]|nr:hypothetical protein [Alphaproteobacteria bacterium]
MTATPPRPLMRRALPGLAVLAVLGLALAITAREPGWTWRPLHPVVVLLLVAVVSALPLHRGVLAVAVVGGTARALTLEPRVLMHFAKPYGFLLDGRGDVSPNLAYGDGWNATHGLVTRLVGWTPDLPHAVSWGLSCLLPPFLFDLVLRTTGRPLAAWTAGLASALLPLAVALAPTPNHFVLVATLQVLAVAGAVRRDAEGDLLAVAAAGLLAHTRPLQLAVVLVPLALLVQGRRWPATAGLVALAGWRVAELATHLHATPTSRPLGEPLRIVDGMFAMGPDAPWLVLDPTRVPLGLTVLAVVGTVALLRRGPGAAWALPALFLGGSLLYLEHRYASDRLRFQLPTLAWLAALAGVGLDALARRSRTLGAAAALLLLVSAWPARAPMDPPFTWQAEHLLLRRAADEVPEGSTVRMAIAHDPDGTIRRWASLRSPGTWVADDGTPHPGELRWVGTADLHPHARPVPWDHLEPLWEQTVPGVWGGLPDLFLDAPYGAEPVRIGLYRVVDPATP